MNRTLNILGIEDDPADENLIRYCLNEQLAPGSIGFSNLYQITFVQDLASARQKLETEVYDLIMTDLNLPDSTGIMTFEALEEAAPTTPMIVLSGLNDVDVARSAVRMGAEDYILKKKLSGEILQESIIFSIERGHVRERIRQASERKSEFMANMSHEIRTPLNGILGMATALLESDLDLDTRQMIETIHVSGENLVQLVSDVLDIAKIEAGKLDLVKKQFDLRKLIEDTLTTFSSKAIGNNIFIADDIDPLIPGILVTDPNRIRQILLNLLNNAFKYTDRGHIVVHAKCLERTDGRVRICISVSDTGSGISAQKLENLFQPFTQIPCSQNEEFRGTGLGLSICRSLSRMMQGEIAVSSQPNHGSVFSFTFEADFIERLSDGRFNRLEQKVLFIGPDPECARLLGNHLLLRGLKMIEVAPEGLIQVGSLPAIAAIVISTRFGDPQSIADQLRLLGQQLGDEIPKIFLTTVDKIHVMKKNFSGPIRTLFFPLKQAEFYRRLFDAIEKNESQEAVTSLPMDQEFQQGIHKRPSRRVLVVDDSEINRAVAHKLLMACECVPTVCESGMQSLTLLDSQTFDLVFMDCRMPDLDGFATTRLIRGRPELAGLPIIALTANAFEEDKNRCLESGMTDFLAKPLALNELKRILLQYLPLKPEENMEAQSGALDEKVIHALKALEGPGEVSFLNELIDIFESKAPLEIEGMIAALAAHNKAEAIHKAHKLKGMAQTLGAQCLRDTCDTIENLYDQLSAAERSDTLPLKLRTQCGDAVTELKSKWYIQG